VNGKESIGLFIVEADGFEEESANVYPPPVRYGDAGEQACVLLQRLPHASTIRLSIAQIRDRHRILLEAVNVTSNIAIDSMPSAPVDRLVL
jgi:hypothetical protein